MRKSERQQIVTDLIRQRKLGSQAELVGALRKMGAPVTQATISRDLREMGVQKGTDREGNFRYILPPPRARRDPTQALVTAMRDGSASCRLAQNLVVVRSDPGSAPAVGLALDGLEHEDIVGTVAGDDTVLLVMPDGVKARQMVEFLEKIMEEG